MELKNKRNREEKNGLAFFLKEAVPALKEKYGMSSREVFDEILSKVEIKVPISIFCDELSTQEVITLYLKEHLGLGFSEIAKLINRSPKTIWQAYQNAKRKQQNKLEISSSRYDLPLSLFSERKLSNLEYVVHYLKKKFDLKYCEIASIVHRNEKTVWTIHKRARTKL